MKKYILLLFLFLTFGITQAQPDGPPGFCECCEAYLGSGGSSTPEYVACVNDCNDGDGSFTYCDPDVVPIDTNVLLLFVLGISFGTFSIYQINKKRQLEK